MMHGRQRRYGEHGPIPPERHQHAAPADRLFQHFRRLNNAGVQSVAGKFAAHDAQRFHQAGFFRQSNQANYLGRVHTRNVLHFPSLLNW